MNIDQLTYFLSQIASSYIKLLEEGREINKDGSPSDQAKSLIKQLIEVIDDFWGDNLDKNTLIKQLFLQILKDWLPKHLYKTINELEKITYPLPVLYPIVSKVKYPDYRCYGNYKGLTYVKEHLCPDAEIFMEILTQENHKGMLVGFRHCYESFKALVAIGEVTYLLDLNQIVWPTADTKDLSHA